MEHDMRGWRNWQTRTFEGRMGDRVGSSPTLRTKEITTEKSVVILCSFLLYRDMNPFLNAKMMSETAIATKAVEKCGKA
jgi:hypothetical protein